MKTYKASNRKLYFILIGVLRSFALSLAVVLVALIFLNLTSCGCNTPAEFSGSQRLNDKPMVCLDALQSNSTYICTTDPEGMLDCTFISEETPDKPININGVY